jgi:hypothetical protein
MEELTVHISKEFKLSDGLENKFLSKAQTYKLPVLKARDSSKIQNFKQDGITPRLCMPLNERGVSHTLENPSIT